MSAVMTISMIVTAINILLIAALSYFYIGSLKKFKSTMMCGLLSFALLFLLQNIVMLYYYATMMPLFVNGIETMVLVYNILQGVAFLILNVITWR